MTRGHDRSMYFLPAIRLTLAFVLAGQALGGVAAGEPASTAVEAFMGTIGSRDAGRVEAALAANPELAGGSIHGVPVLLFAVFAKAPGTPFVRPEENPLVELILERDPPLGIWEASVIGRRDRVLELLDGNPGWVGHVAPSGWTPLHFAAFSGDVETVRLLLDRGADPNAIAWPSSRSTPLNAACFTRRVAVARLLLTRGADITRRQRNGFTALHEAALLGDAEMASVLLDFGAEATARTDDGETPLDVARRRGHSSLIALLEER